MFVIIIKWVDGSMNKYTFRSQLDAAKFSTDSVLKGNLIRKMYFDEREFKQDTVTTVYEPIL